MCLTLFQSLTVGYSRERDTTLTAYVMSGRVQVDNQLRHPTAFRYKELDDNNGEEISSGKDSHGIGAIFASCKFRSIKVDLM
jgi:hypothetical protein